MKERGNEIKRKDGTFREGKGKLERERKRQGPVVEEKRKAAQRGFYDLSGGDKVSGCCVFNGSRPQFQVTCWRPVRPYYDSLTKMTVSM